jgi:hypothetical protein
MDHKIPLYFSNGSPRFQTVVTTTSSRQTSAINAHKILVVLTGDHHWIAFGSNPTATSSSFAMPDSTSFIFEFTPGQKVAAMTHNAEGTITVVNLDSEF